VCRTILAESSKGEILLENGEEQWGVQVGNYTLKEREGKWKMRTDLQIWLYMEREKRDNYNGRYANA
jgi:hypothetical protein